MPMPVRSLRTLETEINVNQLKDHIGALLYTLGIIPDGEEITKLEFGNFKGPATGMIPLKFTLKRDREVLVTTHNGNKKEA